MKIITASLLFMFLPAWAAPLRSPWDATPQGPAADSWGCPAAVPELPHDLNVDSYYSDAHYSIVDPQRKAAYEQGVAGLNTFARALVRAADAYRTANNTVAAQCAVRLLDTAASERALTGDMQSHQADYVQGWMLGSWAVAWLKIRNSGAASDEQSRKIIAWLKKLAKDNKGWYEERRRHNSGDSQNNHLYWAGFAIAAAGIAADDRGLFNWGMNAYREGAHSIRDDGTLPLELARAGRALHYHLYALAPLVLLAELGEANGIDLYAENHYAIKRLVARCVAGLQDPQWFADRTGVRQETNMGPMEVGWAKPYLRRFPDPQLAALLAQVPNISYTDWGGLPPG